MFKSFFKDTRIMDEKGELITVANIDWKGLGMFAPSSLVKYYLIRDVEENMKLSEILKDHIGKNIELSSFRISGTFKLTKENDSLKLTRIKP